MQQQIKTLTALIKHVVLPEINERFSLLENKINDIAIHTVDLSNREPPMIGHPPTISIKERDLQ